jgi:hypothetical protein
VVDEGVTPYNSTTIMLVRQGSGNDGAGTDEINPSDDGDVQLVSAQKGGGKDVANVTFSNTGPTDQTIEKLRISFYFAGGKGDSGKTATSATIDGSTFDIPGTTNTLSKTLPGNKDSFVLIRFDGNKKPGVTGSLFVMTIWFDEAGKQTYFITVPL